MVAGGSRQGFVQPLLVGGEPVEPALQPRELLARRTYVSRGQARARLGPRLASRRSAGVEGRVLLGTQGEVLLHTAGQVAQPAVAQQPHHPVADALEHVAVVRHQDDRPGEAVEQVLQRRERLDVEVVRRLVEQQDVGFVHQEPDELEPATLAAGQLAHARPGPLGPKAHALHEGRRGQGAAAAEVDGAPHGLDRLEDPLVLVELVDLLGEEGGAHRLAPAHPTGGRCEVTGQDPEQRALARPVHPDHADAVTGTEPPGEVVEQHPTTDGDGGVLDVVDALAQPGGGEADQLDGVASRRLVGDERVGGVDAEPRLARARRRAAAQPGELLAQQVLPTRLVRGGDPLALGAGEDVRRVAAVVLVHRAADHVPGPGRHRVQEPAVVGHDHEGSAATRQVPGEPGHGLHVEVVGRFVEHEEVRVVDDQLRASATRRRSPPESGPTRESRATSPSNAWTAPRIRASPAHT